MLFLSDDENKLFIGSTATELLYNSENHLVVIIFLRSIPICRLMTWLLLLCFLILLVHVSTMFFPLRERVV